MENKAEGARLRRLTLVCLAALLTLTAMVTAAGCDNQPTTNASGGGSPGLDIGGKNKSSREGAGDSDWKPYEPKPGEKTTLTVMYASDTSFYQNYGNLFLASHPEVEFTIVDLSDTRGEGDMLANYEKVLAEQKPDVLLMNENQYEALAAKGRLFELGVPMRRSKFDAEGMTPGVIDLLRERGGGQLYGLSPAFESKGLYYNRAIFDAYGVPYPQPGMSWDDLLLLAARFPTKNEAGEPLTGLYQPTFTISPFDLIVKIGGTKRLSLLDAEGTKLMLDGEAWKKVFSQVVEGYRSGAIYYPHAPLLDNGDGTTSISLGSNPFIDGKAAMAIDNLLMMRMMDFLAERKTGDGKRPAAFPWGTAPMPVSPENPGVTPYFELVDIFGINRESARIPLAWEFIQFIHGESFMRLKSKSTFELQSRSGFERDGKGRDLSDFYALGPDSVQRTLLVPDGFTRRFRDLSARVIEDVLADRLTAEEGLAELQKKGQEALDAGYAAPTVHLERFALDEELL
ncbi:ABC transporter substrate-binding protein [Cohnella panacarvi]|uniref:ABC transporter substrate-binding protein n=1 Tax=Cohnella panacarvi TaxID=400776 RepID=UPI00047DB24F|nr:extracellular solute-binding protein [Cohnella panacarvi]